MRVKRRWDEPGFRMTPMIDMTFLLLIFFMVTTKISKDQIKTEARLPIAKAAKVPKDQSERDIVTVLQDGRIFAGSREVDEKELKRHLKERFKNAPPLRLYIRGDQDVKAERMKWIMEVASEAGAVDIIFGTYNR